MRLNGLIAAPFTPFQLDGAIRASLVKPYAEHLAATGVGGAFICGTTGEGSSLAADERVLLAEAWKAAMPDGMKLVVHVGHLSLQESRELAAHAAKIGADAVAAIAPSFYKPAAIDDLIDWCAAIAAAAPKVPFYFYHMPSMTGVNFPIIQFLEKGAKKIPNLAGIKFTYENLMDYHQALAFENGRYDILFGRDEILLAGLSLGARGAVGSSYNFAAPLFLKVIEAWEKQDLPAARAAQLKAIGLISILAGYGGLPAAKAAMRIVGIDCGDVRTPLRSLDEDQQAELKAELARGGFLQLLTKSESANA